MNNKPTIAVLGASGRTGRFVVARLLHHQYRLKVLVRDPKSFDVDHDLIDRIHGDAIDSSSISKLLQDCDAIISTIGQRKDEPLVAACSTGNIIREMQVQGLRRFVLLAGLNVDVPLDQKGPQTRAATTWMKTNFPLIQEDRQKAYSLLAASAIDWTMVRVPVIGFTEGISNYKVSVEDCPGTSISAGDIAAFLVDQLEDMQYVRKCPFIGI